MRTRLLSLAAAMAVLGATHGFVAEATAQEPIIFDAQLSGDLVAPDYVETLGVGTATAVLVGNALIVSGNFTGLSSDLRDVDTSPVDPGVHVHIGAEGERGPSVFGVPVSFYDDRRSGMFQGRFTLDQEQLAALEAGLMYIDVHTKNFPDGEIRSQLTSGYSVLDVRIDETPPGGADSMDMMDHGGMDHGGMDHGDMDHGDMDHGDMDHGNQAPQGQGAPPQDRPAPHQH